MNTRAFLRKISLDGLGALEKLRPEASRSGLGTVLLMHQTPKSCLSSLRWLVVRLRSMGDIVSYSEAVTRVEQGRSNRPFFALTFDDGFSNNLDAARLLKEEGVSACFFVCSGILDSTLAERDVYCASRLFCPPVPFLDWIDVEKLLEMGHEIGSHTVNHVRLSNCSADELEDELGGSCSRLTERLGNVDHFAWPYGRFSDFSAEAAEATFRSGYVSCASGVRGAHKTLPVVLEGAFCVRRENIDLDWPKHHIKYFLEASARAAVNRDSTWLNNQSLENWFH